MNTLVGFIKKEFAQILRDYRMRALLFVAPLIQLTLFSVAISNEVKNIRLAVIASPQDEIANLVTRKAAASGWFIMVEQDNAVEPFELVRSGRAEAVLVAPPGGFTEAYVRDSRPVQLLVDSTNVLRGQQVDNYVQAIFRAAVKERFPVLGPQAGVPIEFDVRILYNPEMITSVFMVPGVMSLILCLLTIVLTSMAITREKEMGTFETLVAAPVSTTEIILGKTVPYIVLGTLDSVLILTFAILVFGVPQKGPLIILIFSMFVFICATVAIGTFISTISKTQQQAMLGGFLFLFPAIQFSGLMFPIENMPIYMRFFSAINPLSYFIVLQRNIMLKGGDASIILKNLAALVAIGVVMIAISFTRFKKKLS